MRPAYVVFSTPRNRSFTWLETLEDVENAELEELIVECRSALCSLEAERAARLEHRVDTSLEHYYQLLRTKAATIKEIGLSAQDLASLKASQARKSRTDRGSYLYEQLSWQITQLAGLACALLFICSVSKRKFERLTAFQTVNLLKYVVRYRDLLLNHTLIEKAAEVGLRKITMKIYLTRSLADIYRCWCELPGSKSLRA